MHVLSGEGGPRVEHAELSFEDGGAEPEVRLGLLVSLNAVEAAADVVVAGGYVGAVLSEGGLADLPSHQETPQSLR